MKLLFFFIGLIIITSIFFFLFSFSAFASLTEDHFSGFSWNLLSVPVSPKPHNQSFSRFIIPSPKATHTHLSINKPLNVPYLYTDDTPYIASFWNIAQSTPSSLPTSSPIFSQKDTAIHFHWLGVSPGKKISKNHFYVEWTKQMFFSDGNYRFFTDSEGGVRVYLDDRLILENWLNHPLEKNSVDKTISSGIHTLKVVFYQIKNNGQIDFHIEKTANEGTSFTGEYFPNKALEGLPVISRQDTGISFDWQNASPDPLLLSDYSVRWTKQQHFSLGNYTFSLSTSGGVRFWIDTMLLVDDWKDHSLKTYTPSIALPEGMHTLKIEYFGSNDSPSISFLEQ